jgi:hypothetical protein
VVIALDPRLPNGCLAKAPAGRDEGGLWAGSLRNGAIAFLGAGLELTSGHSPEGGHRPLSPLRLQADSAFLPATAGNAWRREGSIARGQASLEDCQLPQRALRTEQKYSLSGNIQADLGRRLGQSK